MIYQMAENWLSAYKEAWLTRDPDAIAALFIPDGQYFETPFLVHKGHDKIRAYWSQAPGIQQDIKFQYKILSTYAMTAIAHWGAQFIRAGSLRNLDGIFLLEFDPNGKCKTLREWWHSNP